jgi:folylpolyglutamate synthase
MTERIRIDGIPLSQEKFAQNFFEVYDKISGDLRFTQLLALVAFHTFHKERVGAAVIETSVGGEYDATNVIQKPVVTGVTSIGIDHVDTLGSELGQIAWHKGGIFKSGVPAFSICQEPAAKAALLARAAEKGADLQFVGLDPRLPDSPNLEMQAQRLNYSLAIATVHAYIKLKAPEESLTSTDILKGVNNVNFPGRFQLISEGNFKWHLDVAHNEMSMKVAAEWFAIRASKPERYEAYSIPIARLKTI